MATTRKQAGGAAKSATAKKTTAAKAPAKKAPAKAKAAQPKGKPAPRKTAPSKKAPAKKSPAKKGKAAPKKAAPAKKAPAKKAAPPAKNSSPAKKGAPSKKAPAKKAPAKKAVAKKAAPPVKKTTPMKKTAPAKKAPAKKAQPAPKKTAPAKKAPPAKSAAKKVSPTGGAVASREASPGHGQRGEGIGLLSRRAKPVERRKEGYTDARWLTHQRSQLDTERATYLAQAESLRAEAEALVQEMEPGDIQFDDESGEGATSTVDRERDLALSAQALQAVEEIDHAIAKMKSKTYGICENCGRLITKPRLEALPFARLCIDCKSGGLSRR